MIRRWLLVAGLFWVVAQHPAVAAQLAAFGRAWQLEASPCVRVYGALWRPSPIPCDLENR